MHEIEAFVGAAVCAAADSGLPASEKRNLIHTLFNLESKGDTGFTNARTLKETTQCQYTFVFDKQDMWDYAENRRYYDIDLPRKEGYTNGGLYICRGQAGGFPEWEGKVCVDAGSKAWQAMVNAGKITGQGAAPVRQMDEQETLQKSRYLITRQTGGMPAHIRRGMIAIFFLTETGKIGDVNATRAALTTLLGPKGTEDEAYPAPGRVYYFLGEMTPMVADQEWWEDASWVFYGYRTAEPVTLSLWGKEIPCDLGVQLTGGPIRINPFAEGGESVGWLLNARETQREIAAFEREMDDLIKSAYTRGASPVLKKCMNWDKMRAQMAVIRKISATPGIGLEEAVTGLTGAFAEMAGVLENARIPESVLGERSPCTALLARLKVMVHGYLELEKRGKPLDIRLYQVLGQLAFYLENFLARYKQIVRRRTPPSIAEAGQTRAWQEELAELEKAPERANNARRAELMENLWRSEVMFIDDRGIYAAKLTDFYAQAGGMIEAKRREATLYLSPQGGGVPDLAQPLAVGEAQICRLQSLPLEQVRAVGGDVLAPALAGDELSPTLALVTLPMEGGAAAAQLMLGLKGQPHAVLLTLEGEGPPIATRVSETQ
ncbi:MAG: hypothetical protein FWE32_08135 [Oscillospiraceae bacterium]|nr:hypothetical protein [Oscillospiraceae bacterium]